MVKQKDVVMRNGTQSIGFKQKWYDKCLERITVFVEGEDK